MKEKICFYINTFVVGGIEKVLIETLQNIDKNKFEIKLLIGFKLDELEKLKTELPSDIQVDYVLKDNFFCKNKKKKSIGNLKKYEKIIDESLSWLKKIIFKKNLKEKIKDTDVVIDFDMTLAPYADKISKKIIAFCHFSPKNYNRGIKRRQIKLGRRLKNYNKIVVISDEMKKEMVELFPFLKNKVIRIYNSFNIEKIKKLSLQTIPNTYINDKYILAIGRLEETQKDFTTLIKSYSLIEKEIGEKLFIIGEGRHKKDLIELVKNLKIEKKVKFLGFQKNPYPWIKKASLFVHSSKFEGLPTVVIEALILEKLIVATDCPTGPKEILDNGRNGILTEIGNAKELSEAMKKMLLNNTDKELYIKNLKNKVKEFDSKNVIKELEQLILKI